MWTANNYKLKQAMMKVFFYSNVKSKRQFSIQNFYRTDIKILKGLGYKVSLCKSFLLFFQFWKYDLAIIYFFRYGLFSAIIARLLGKKVIFTGGIDYLDLAYAGKKRYLIQAVFFKLCNVFSTVSIIVSKSDLKNIAKLYSGKLPPNIVYIPHSINCSEFQNLTNTKKESIITTICWMGRIENVIRKGVDRTILVFRNIVYKFPNYKLYIIGPLGEGTEFLKKIVIENDLESNVFFTGEVTEKEKLNYLERSKYYFQLSEYEGFGIAAIEALITGNIVFHSGRGGLKDSIGNEGVLISDIDDYKLIADTFFNIENSNSFSQIAIQNQIKYVKDNFDLNTRINGIKTILDKLYT